MVQNLKILNSRETKKIHILLNEQYGFSEKIDALLLLSEKKEKIYLFTKDIVNIDTDSLKIDSMGLYFGAFFKDKLRLTIDGSQLIGKFCKKNLIALNKQEMQSWMSGATLEINNLENKPEAESGEFVIVKYEKDFLGCGKISGEKILNYIPKTRYIHALY